MIGRLLRSNVIIALLTNGFSAALGLLTFALLARWLPKVEFGFWLFFLVIFGLVELFRTGLIQMAFIHYRKQLGINIKELLGSTWTLGFISTGILCLVCGFVYLLFYLFGAPSTFFAYPTWIALMLLVGLPYNFCLWLYQADGHFVKILAIRLALLAVFLLLTCISHATSSLTILDCFKNYTLAYLLASLAAIGLRNTGVSFLFYSSRSLLVKLINYGKFSMGTMIASNLLRSSDNLLIGPLMGAGAVASYGIPFKFIELLEMPLRSIVSVFIPKMAELVHTQGDKNQAKQLYLRYTGGLTIIFIPAVIAVAFFAQWLIVLLSGSEYIGSAILLQILILYCIFLPLDRLSGVTLDLIGKPQVNFRKVLLMLSVNILGDLVAILFFHSLKMVALASLLTFFTGLVYGNVHLIRYFDYRMKDVFIVGWQEIRRLMTKFSRK